MHEKTRRSSSVYHVYRSNKKSKDLLDRKVSVRLSGNQLTVGFIFGVFLTLITIALQSFAFFTPHWKEISPKTHSLYIDGVDALIRTEILIYFNSVHRFTRHSYGLFQRCEYPLTNVSQPMNQRAIFVGTGLIKNQKICTKNYLPLYKSEHFDECHSLPYYRFCSKTSETNFNIDSDYLRASFGISPKLPINKDKTSSCKRHYPSYVNTCHIVGIFALVFLFLTTLLFGLFPFLKNRYQRLKFKCLGVLCSLFSTLFILVNLLVVLNHLEYESLEYLVTIEKHYRSTQIYRLSLDVKLAIDRFLSSIIIETGYSVIISWIAFVLSIINGFLLMLTCKISDDQDDITNLFSGTHMDSPIQSQKMENEEDQTSSIPLTSAPKTTTAELLPPSSFYPPPPPPLPTVVITGTEEQSNSSVRVLPSCLKQPSASRIRFDADG